LSTLSFVKLGLAGFGADQDWVDAWLRLRDQLERAAGRALPWVAVAYADARRAAAPSVNEIIDAAAESGCRGVLLDTYDKQSGSLLDCCSIVELARYADQARTAGMFFALAGKLIADDLRRPEFRCADIIGVRSAACDGGDRQRKITAERVAGLRQRLMVDGR
jgi:uncharacterized protein (UPF0264 family)